jgi:hypothetical protein
MSIKLTVRQAVAAFQAIECLPRLKDSKMAYNLGYIANHLESGIHAFEKERDKLQRTLLVIEDRKDEKTGKTEKVRVIPVDKQSEWSEEIEQMLDGDIEVEREPLKFSAVFPDPPANLSPEDLVKYEEKYPRPTAAQLRPLIKIIVE